jgi:hypothetical protein
MDIDLQEGEKKEEPTTADSSVSSNKPKLPLRQRIANFFKNPKKRLIFEICLGLVLIAIFAFGLIRLTRSGGTTPPETKKEAPPEVKYSSVLDGVMVTDQAAANRHPLAISVENDPAARPQSGLDKASIIYETVYDPAATTRFLALFGENEAEKVGPVRSARTFFVDWAHGYDAYFAHWGGNIDALDQIRKEKTYDLDEFAFPGVYWREGNKSSEHTGYTSTVKLRTQAEKNKYPAANNFTVYKYKDDPDKTTLPASQKIMVNFSSAQYKADFTYDPENNSYKRNIAGSPDLDAVTKNQQNPKVVAVMTVARKQTTTRINESGYTMTTVGSGKAQIFMDGKVVDGTWKKNSTGEREIFYDAASNEIVFDRGQLWICVVADSKVVTAQ